MALIRRCSRVFARLAGMGDFRVPLEISGLPEGRFEPVVALVDTGATYTWIPRDILDRRGIQPEEDCPFVLADGSEVTYPIATVRARLGGRIRSTLVVFGELASEPLLGVVTLEEFRLAVDPIRKRLFPVPALLKLAG